MDDKVQSLGSVRGEVFRAFGEKTAGVWGATRDGLYKDLGTAAISRMFFTGLLFQVWRDHKESIHMTP